MAELPKPTAKDERMFAMPKPEQLAQVAAILINADKSGEDLTDAKVQAAVHDAYRLYEAAKQLLEDAREQLDIAD
jgi:F0F1-type ATP synthase membrane subunit b/b'